MLFLCFSYAKEKFDPSFIHLKYDMQCTICTINNEYELLYIYYL